MSHQTQKGLDSGVSLWWSKFGHSFQVLFAELYTFLGDMMSQVDDFVLEELALGWLELHIVISEALEHNMQVV